MLNWLRRKPTPQEPQRERPPDSHAILFGQRETAAPAVGEQPSDLFDRIAETAPVAAAAKTNESSTVGPSDEQAIEPTLAAVVLGTPDDVQFRTPGTLATTGLRFDRALIIGSCFSHIFCLYLGHVFHGVEVDHIVYNHAGTLPEAPPHPVEAYDLQIVMLPLRTAMPEQLYFRLPYNDPASHEEAFQQAKERLVQMLHHALKYRETRQIVTFVANFTVPQQNPMGRLLPRYDLRNPVYFVELLNRVIADEIADLADVHLLDVDGISANFGRKYSQDDLVSIINHGSILADWEREYDKGRLEVPPLLSTLHYSRVGEFIVAICHEMHAMVRTLRQTDQVKIVIVDLDDTLWRGVVAEEGIHRPALTEGWPVGFAEALAFLKKRGVLLAIVSKNDEARIRELWPDIYGSRLELSDFASIMINWAPKADNVARVLQQVNLLPRSAVFIDDNPAERDNVKSTFPDIRVLGASPYEFRRTLLWAAETQVATVTEESSRRTEMVQAQAERETSRSRLSRAEFLDTLGVDVRLFGIADVKDQRFARAFELVNKSNQFNTTGRRWTQDECQDAFARGVTFWGFEVDDRFTRYGLVGVAIMGEHDIVQFVMSCRVMGLDVEIAVLAALLENTPGEVTAACKATDANFPCRDLYKRCGFVEAPEGWRKEAGLRVQRPPHVRAIERRLAEAVG